MAGLGSQKNFQDQNYQNYQEGGYQQYQYDGYNNYNYSQQYQQNQFANDADATNAEMLSGLGSQKQYYPSLNFIRKKASNEDDEAWLNAAEEEKDYFPTKEISPTSADKRSQSRILSEEGEQVISIKGHFSIHKDMGNDNLAE